MYNLNKIIEHIKKESENECKNIAVKANKEVARIRTLYLKKEQEAYNSRMKEGSIEIEKRVEELSNHANEQANKMVHATEQGVLDDVLDLAAKKLSALPKDEYNKVLKRLGIEEGCKPEYLVEIYREELAPSVISALFDSGNV